jgi:hypothetical protein
MQIYVPFANNDTLTVEFMDGNLAKRTANFLCNTRGWREFNRAYTEYSLGAFPTAITTLRFTLKPTDAALRKIFFDDIHVNRKTQTGRVPGTQWVLDREYMTTDTGQAEYYDAGNGNRPLRAYANAVYLQEIPLTTPTAQELADLDKLRTTFRPRLIPAHNAAQAAIARDYVNNTLKITRNSDGTVSGKVINTTVTGLVQDSVVSILQGLVYLAGAVQATGAADMKTAFTNYLDHVLDQGFSEGCNFVLYSNAYAAPRAVLSLLLNLIPVCEGEQLSQIIKLARWLSFYDTMYEPESAYLRKINSDIIYVYSAYIQNIAVFHPDDATAVRELKVLKRFLERNTEYVPGANDMLKPDGTGFHHNTNYNGYMFAYKTFTDCIFNLKGTVFRISPEPYNHFKKALLSLYIMATRHTNNSHYYALALCGRHPFSVSSGDASVAYTKSQFEDLIAVGLDSYGQHDEELEGAYNYFFMSNKYAVPEKKWEGFYQFNYGSMAIFRRANWVVTMHAPTSKTWGSEIYSGTNRFGRYQSHGSLDVTYGGGTLSTCGYPNDATGGGWDWNVAPGTTTVHYTSWQEMMPNRNTTDRFDQFTKTKNFSGALSFGDCGIFATDFDQIDTWASQRFTPTNLVFKKSMYAFDNLIISLGSDISSSGSYSDNMLTATNLFQNIISSVSGDFVLNGNVLPKPYRQTLESTGNNWLITPHGTGYYIPQGNDPIEVFYDTQTTPKESGADYAAPTTTATAAKAYLKHGIKPASKSYRFVVVPAATREDMENLASQVGNDGGNLFTIHSQTASMHAVTYKPQNITAYTFFAANSNIPFGIVKSVTAAHLLMDKKDTETGRHYFAISNPDLNPQSNSSYGWVANPTETTIILEGEWSPVSAVAGVRFSTPVGGKTSITVQMNDGEPVYFAAKIFDGVSIEPITVSKGLTVVKKDGYLQLSFSSSVIKPVDVAIYSVAGTLLYKRNNVSENIQIPVNQFPKGVFLCVVSDANKSETYKFIN